MKILATCGSLRKASFNRRLLAWATEALNSRGAEVEFFDLKIHALPIYDGDLEPQFPKVALEYKERISKADGLLWVTPENNHNIPACLKNAIDWASRPLPKLDGKPHPLTQPFRGKLAAFMGATTGMGGTIYCQLAMRELMNTLGAWGMPGQFTLSHSEETIGEREKLEESHQKRLDSYVEAFVAEVKRRNV